MFLKAEKKLIILFKAITVFCGIDSIMWNIRYMQSKYGEYSIFYCQSNRIYRTFRLNVRNIRLNIVSSTEHCYGSE
jgi:hypothetical protein